MMSLSVWLLGPMFLLDGSVPGPMLISWVPCESGGCLREGRRFPSLAETPPSQRTPYHHLVAATEAGGTHPTGIHSCYEYFYLLRISSYGRDRYCCTRLKSLRHFRPYSHAPCHTTKRILYIWRSEKISYKIEYYIK